MKRVLLIISIIFFCFKGYSQSQDIKSIFKDIVLKIDTLQYRYSKDVVNYQGQFLFSFLFNKPDEVCEINLYPYNDNLKHIELLKSADFQQLDSIVYINNEYFRTRIKFANLNKSQFLSFILNLQWDGTEKTSNKEVKLLPITKTSVSFAPNTDELYIGEEKAFELLTNNISNIRLQNEWTTGLDINYRITENNGQLWVHMLPTSLGTKYANIRLQTNSPYLNNKKEVIYDLPAIIKPFKVKASRLAFLNIDKKEITLDETTKRNGFEIQLDNHRQLAMNKTYRVEDQEQPGGPLIAEVYTKSYLANDRVLCIIRPFNLHRQNEGYLYMKDDDEPKFITNVNITPKTTISGIQLMHEGQDWSSNLNVNPGETVDVKIEGEGLHKARFHWEDVNDITSDTAIRSETQCYFKLKIPLDINKQKIVLYNNIASTGMALNIKEYQSPRNFDFITLNFGDGSKTLSSLSTTIIQRKTIKDVTIGFNNAKIDGGAKLFGKQYLDIDLKVIGKSGELMEMKSLKNLVICPGDNSPRAPYYRDKSCTNDDVRLNNVLSTKTSNLNDFSKIQMEVRQQSDKYSEPTYTKQVEIVLQRPSIFDIDVSFPAGLMIQNLGKTQTEKDNFAQYDQKYAEYLLQYKNYLNQLLNGNLTTAPIEPAKPSKAAFTDNLGGISLALIMQFSFPDPEKVGCSKPYRFGAGFLAINAFNFNQSAQRDLAAVALASLYPIKPGKLFSLPIHFGFGYKFQDKIPFIMLSPGIGVSF
jgi:hypothetical protein